MEINHQARLERHEKIGIDLKRIYKKKSDHLLSRILLIGFFIIGVDLLHLHFSYYKNIKNSYSMPELASDGLSFDEDGFVLKKSLQTENRKIKSNEIITHEVKPGESLVQISADYQIKLSTILSANPHVSPWKTLSPGTKLEILPVDGLAITLEKDIFLDEILKKYKVKKSSVLSQNSLGTGALILEKGTTLILPGAKPIVYTKTFATNAPSDPSNYKYTGTPSSYRSMPANGTFTQYYNRYHYAVDIANKNKGPIYAAADGVVVEAASSGWNGGYGNVIIVDHGGGMKTLYAHNEKIYVGVGDQVKQGDTIAWMGRTGRVRGVTGIHLHFEVIVNGVKRNPLAYIK